MRRLLISFLAILSLAAGCTASGGRHARAVYVLLDVSESYNQKLDAANPVINYLLGTLVSGDSLFVGKIDSGSFTQDDVVGKITFDDRPSVANEQKRAFRARLDQFFAARKPSTKTDVSGALLQAAESLDESGAGRRYILVFSDLDEDLPKGYVRKSKLPLEGAEVLAVDVTKEHADNVNPQRYMDRLDHWKQLVTKDGGSWAVINDTDRLDRVLN
ncbi:MAG TPA: VWA domain-containing protein [Gammaproteobacteria bacterium]|nr:VWA domain-containing protein [Gammaproteobacteria bacterium]